MVQVMIPYRLVYSRSFKDFYGFMGYSLGLGGDFNVFRLPSKRSTRGRLTSVMSEFPAFINLCNLVDSPLEGA